MSTAQVAQTVTNDADHILQPSNDIKELIDKVVGYLAKNPEMESRLVKEQGGNEKMSFLTPASPYFAYYKQRLFQEKAPVAALTSESNDEENAAKEPEKEEIKKPDDFQWILPIKPSSIPSMDYDLIRLVAQYVAHKGRAFQMGLWNRERSNPLYGFLSNHHPLHDLYQHLVADYTRIILRDKPLLESHKPEMTSRKILLEKVRGRAKWKQSQLKSDEEKRAEEEAERNAAATIDWNDAIIVETISFNPAEDALLPAPIEQSKLLSVYLAAKQKEEEEKQRRQQQQQMSSESSLTAYSTASNPNIAVPTANITTSEPKTAADIQRGGPKKMTTLCPICRRPFPIDEIEGHMKVEMAKGGSVAIHDMNRNRSKQPEYAPVIATGEDIAEKLSKIAKRRTDLFGDEDDERSLLEAQRMAREKKEKEAAAAFAAVSHSGPSQSSMNDHYPPMAAMPVPSNIPAPVNRANQFLSQLPPPSGSSSNTSSYEANSGKRPATSSIEQLDEAPAAKRSKGSEVIDLIPEKDFAAQHPDPISLTISLPEGEGDNFDITVPIMTSVKTLKDELVKSSKIPVNKQILKIEHLGFLKDKLTMAHYNLTSGTLVQLSTKERGGRKK
jgi:splicing factor 3A subunit 1